MKSSQILLSRALDAASSTLCGKQEEDLSTLWVGNHFGGCFINTVPIFIALIYIFIFGTWYYVRYIGARTALSNRKKFGTIGLLRLRICTFLSIFPVITLCIGLKEISNERSYMHFVVMNLIAIFYFRMIMKKQLQKRLVESRILLYFGFLLNISYFMQFYNFLFFAVNHSNVGIGGYSIFIKISIIICFIFSFIFSFSYGYLKETGINPNLSLPLDTVSILEQPLWLDEYTDESVVCEGEGSVTSITSQEKRNISPEKKTNFFGIITFSWISDLIALGSQKSLDKNDLYPIKKEVETKAVAKNAVNAMRKQIPDGNGYKSLLKLYLSLYGGRIFYAGCLKFVYDSLLFAGPLCVYIIVTFLQQPNASENIPEGIGYVGLMFTLSVIQSSFLHQYFHTMYGVGVSIRGATSSLVYRKSLKLCPASLSAAGIMKQQFSSMGEVVNLMAVDIIRIQDSLPYVHLLWSAPYQIILALFFLTSVIGVSAAAGLGVMLISAPIAGIIANRVGKVQKSIMFLKDARLKKITEFLGNMRVLKYYCWEFGFASKVTETRKQELQKLWHYRLLDATSGILWQTVPSCVALASFTLFVFLSYQVSAATIFTALSLFNILRFPMALLPVMVNNVVETRVSLKRLNAFLNINEIPQKNLKDNHTVGQTSTSYYTENSNIKESFSIIVSDLSISYYTIDGEYEAIKDISFKVKPGTVTALVGPIGVGKSSLLLGLISELSLKKGNCVVKGTIGYCAQSAWIRNATIRDNILFHSNFNENKYNQVIDACALNTDLASLPAGDFTEIGEKGVTLSGGQKQRVALARAVYQDCDVYLLDDPLSAVDSLVARYLFEHCIRGLLKDKTIIIVTHKIDLLPMCDNILFLKTGLPHFFGPFSKIKEDPQYNVFAMTADVEETMGSSYRIGGLDTAIIQTNDDNSTNNVLDNALDNAPDNAIETASFNAPDNAPFNAPDNAPLNAPDNAPLNAIKEQGKLIEEEKLKEGKVAKEVYMEYFKGIGGLWTCMCIIFLISLTSGLQISSSVWLSVWSDNTTTISPIFGLKVYAFFLCCQVCAACLYYFSLAYAAACGACYFHERILDGVSRATISFLESTPVGRIINRFSRDIYVIDETLPSIMSMYIGTFFQVLGAIGVITYCAPAFLIIAIPIIIIYMKIKNYYVTSSRQLQRIESVSKSPIFSFFSETLGGLSTIRAFNRQQNCIECNEYLLGLNCIAYYHYVASNRWLAIRLEFLGSLIIGSAGLFAVLFCGSRTSAGLGGLALSYSLNITNSLNWFVRMSSDLESNIVSVERVKEYSQDIPKEQFTDDEVDITKSTELALKEIEEINNNFHTNISICFNDYSLKYRSHLPMVLKNLSFNINKGERVGVVGRTGAGKSSLLTAMLRMIEPSNGTIYINDKDIKLLKLTTLRKQFSIIPQDPVLFEGTLRYNIDPLNQYSDDDVLKALEQSHCNKFIRHLSNLSMLVEEHGSNFSAGQKQLLCLARALLRNSKIIVMDEATAVVDPVTDKYVQTTIANEFKNCTVLTIAHRLHTIMHYDRILVLDSGYVAEFDTPKNLMMNSQGHLFSLVQAAEKTQYKQIL